MVTTLSDTEYEDRLLNSEDEESAPAPVPDSAPVQDPELVYQDRRPERAQLRVSTLYYPGRPQYSVSGLPVGGSRERSPSRKRVRRYYEVPYDADRERELRAAELAELHDRAAAYRRALADRPTDVALWVAYLDFQERFGAPDDSLREAARAELSCGPVPSLRRRRLRAAREHLSDEGYAALLRDMLATEEGPGRAELWTRLMWALAGRDDSAVLSVAEDASRDPRGPRSHEVVYHYGAYLRAAGLHERLVALVTALVEMNFPRASPAPTPRLDTERLRKSELELASNGLPGRVLWSRVERARAAELWWPYDGCADDPQRDARPADVAGLLRAVGRGMRTSLSARLVRLAGCSGPPGSGWVHAHLPEPACSLTDGCALLPLLEARLRVSGALPAAANRLVRDLIEPPAMPDANGAHEEWGEWVWRAVGEECGVAMLSWRVRTAALRCALAAADGGASADAVRRRALRSLRPELARADCPLLYAEATRLARCGPGDIRSRERALLSALDAASLDTYHQRLYIARIAYETGCSSSVCQSMLTCAALGLRAGAAEGMDAGRGPALLRCREECARLERDGEAGDGEGDPAERALLPAGGEWGRARARLELPAAMRAWAEKLAAGPPPVSCTRYHEECCEAAAEALRSPELAARLSRLHPHNAVLAVLSAPARPAAPTISLTCELARLLPALLSGAAHRWSVEWGAREGAALARNLRRSPWLARCPLVSSLRLRTEAAAGQAGRAAPAAASLLARHPYHKWGHVQAAVTMDHHELADLLLERGLRLHTLPLELDSVQ